MSIKVTVTDTDGHDPGVVLASFRTCLQRNFGDVDVELEMGRHLPPVDWHSHLFTDPEYPNEGPFVKGTLVTVDHVVTMVLAGHSWKAILRTHPELSEDDIRACLRYSINELDDDDEYSEETVDESEQGPNPMVEGSDEDVESHAVLRPVPFF